MRIRILSLAATIAATLAISPAWSHTHLVRSTPAANATVAASPKTITLTFSERLVPAFSKFDLVMPSMQSMAVPLKTAVSADRMSIVGSPQHALQRGAYKILWTAASADGHKMKGEVAFSVR